MIHSASHILGASSPLGSHLPALFAILAGIAVLMFAIRFLGLWLAAGHPDDPASAVPVKSQAPAGSPAVPDRIPPHILAVIAAATSVTIKDSHRIVAVTPAKPPTVEGLMQQWSWEGRRQIYSSHQFR